MNTSPESEYEFGSCYSSLGRFPSTSSVTGILPSQLPPPQLNTMQSRQPVSPNGGLGELSGMLAAKMSFGHPGTKTTFGNGSVDEMARRRNFLLDDAQSRDSGEILTFLYNNLFKNSKRDTKNTKTNHYILLTNVSI